MDELISGKIVLDRLYRSNVLGLGQVGQHGELLSKLRHPHGHVTRVVTTQQQPIATQASSLLQMAPIRKSPFVHGTFAVKTRLS